MASSSDEKNQRNAKILQANVFYNDLCIISQEAFKLFDHKKHHFSFLQDNIEFTHIMLEMLDEYSKGKVLTIQTQKKRKVKKNKKKAAKKQRDDLDEFADELEFSDDDFSEGDDEENVERTFNFVSELSRLVDYEVIEKYAYLLKNEAIFKNKPLLLRACTSFFKRIISQTKQTWIFF
jgi:hypothetical protein